MLAILLPSRLGGDPKDQILLRVRPLCSILPLHLFPSLQLFPVVMLTVDDDVATTPFGFVTPLHQRFSSRRRHRAAAYTPSSLLDCCSSCWSRWTISEVGC